MCVLDIVSFGLGIWQHLGGSSPPFRFSSDWFLKHLLGFGAIFHFTLVVVVVVVVVVPPFFHAVFPLQSLVMQARMRWNTTCQKLLWLVLAVEKALRAGSRWG